MSTGHPTSDSLQEAFWVWEEDYDVPEPALGRMHTAVLCDPVARLNAPAPIVLREIDTIALAVERMRKRRYGSALVASEDGKLRGIFTEHDLVTAADVAHLDGRDWTQLPLGEVMTRDPQCVSEEDSLAVALHHMSVGGYRHLPIVRDGRPVGFVSIRGILKYISLNAL